MKKNPAKKQALIRDQELELLLSISSDLATVRSAAGLLEVVASRLKNLIGFSYIHIARINDDGQTFSSLISDPKGDAVTHPSYADTRTMELPVADGFADRSIKSSMPECFDLAELRLKDALPFYYEMVYESGTRQVVISRLTKGDKVFGLWFILFTHSDPVDQNSIRLIKGISHQISSAISNIISNDEIMQREQEKTRLLEFSDAIASVRDKDVLAKLVHHHLWSIFGMVDYCIWLNSKQKDERIAFLYDKDTPIAKSPLFQQGLQIFTSSHDYLFRQALTSDDVTFLEEKDWVSTDQPGFSYGIYSREFNVTGFGSNRIRLADEDLAVIVFSHNNIREMRKKLPLYRSICSQLAVALSNILATSKVNEQLKEINQFKEQLEVEKNYLQEEIATGYNAADMVGNSSIMKEMYSLINKVATSASTVLITGETGTGKELVARAIHINSPRKEKLLVKVNCAALPPNLIESELFGHERGSFTGAFDRRIGKFELADHGTLFLDEIGELPLDLQAKLLRALQEKEIERVGGKTTIKVNTRIIAATNRDLEKEVGEGRFREDLFYRLNIFPIGIPALRDRSEDIPALTNYFVEKFAKQTGKKIKGISKAAMKEIMGYHWPGNIRELEHFIERSILLSTGDIITNISLRNPTRQITENPKKEFKPQTIDDNERELIVKTLDYCSGQIAGPYGAAKVLGVPPTTLHSKMKKLNIVKKFERGKLAMLLLVVLTNILTSNSTAQTAKAETRKPITNAAHFHHIHLNVTNPEKTIAYYEKFFGAGRINFRGKSKALFTEKSFILIDSVAVIPRRNSGTSLWHIGWAGVDGNSEFQWRIRGGIQVQSPIAGFKIPDVPDSVHAMYFFGPDSEIVEVSTVNHNHRFEHVHLLASNIEMTSAWFRDNLGLIPAFEKAINFYGLLMNSFVIDNVNLVVFAKPSPDAKSDLLPDGIYPGTGFRITDGSVIDHIAFSYGSIPSVFERLKASGIPIVKSVGVSALHGLRSFFIRGPDGLLVEIVEEKQVPEGIW